MLSTAYPTPFPIPFGNSAGAGYIRTIPQASQIGVTAGAASLTDGFPPLNFLPVTAGGVPPFGQDMNGILKEITQAVQWQQAGGLPIYDSTFQTAIGGYPNGAAILNSNGNGFWISTVDNNLTNPNTGGAGWKNLAGTYLDKSVAGAVDVTLTVLEATYAIIDLTGALTGNINVIVPSVGNRWTIRNSTSGAFTINVKTAAGTGVLVAQGSTIELYSDGTNVYAANPVQSGIVGLTRNFVMNITAASASATITADELVVETSLGGTKFFLSNFSKVINLATTGVGGMDTGTAPLSGFVGIYAIYNPTTATSALLAINATSIFAPNIYGGANMPSGYTASALISVWPTNGSGQLFPGYQTSRSCHFSGTTVLTGGTNLTQTSISIASTVPKNAINCKGYALIYSAASAGQYGANITADTINNGLASFSGYVNAASVGTINTSSNFTLPLTIQQTIYYQVSTTNGALSVVINGYEF